MKIRKVNRYHRKEKITIVSKPAKATRGVCTIYQSAKDQERYGIVSDRLDTNEIQRGQLDLASLLLLSRAAKMGGHSIILIQDENQDISKNQYTLHPKARAYLIKELDL